MKKRYMPVFLAAAVFAGMLTGCGERVDQQQQTEKQTEAATEKITDAIQIETQPVTEKPAKKRKKKQTEKQTEKPTEAPTEADVNLTPEEEQARESELAAEVTYYANDNVNIRLTPNKDADNVIGSYEKGESVQVTGKTPHWYKVRKIDSESGETVIGYVIKDYISETAIDLNASAPEQTAPVQEVQEVQPEPQQSTVQVAEGVSGFAERFPITIASAANVRASASESGEFLGVLEAGAVVTAIGETGSWYQIDYNGTSGFVHKNLVA